MRPAWLLLIAASASCAAQTSTPKKKAGIQPAHANKLSAQLALLNRSVSPNDMDWNGWDLHPLKGDLEGHWSVKVNGNWRLTFMFNDTNAEVVDYQDYH